jgi:hypothetical protein
MFLGLPLESQVNQVCGISDTSSLHMLNAQPFGNAGLNGCKGSMAGVASGRPPHSPGPQSPFLLNGNTQNAVRVGRPWGR